MSQLNQAGIDLIKSFESCKLVAYQDQKGIWTIGWGHTANVNEGDTCTQEQADQWLIDDLQNAENVITSLISVDLTDNQYSALVSLVFNCGSKPLHGHLGTYLTEGNFDAAAQQFLVWNHVGSKVDAGLTRRREAEKELFLTPTG